MLSPGPWPRTRIHTKHTHTSKSIRPQTRRFFGGRNLVINIERQTAGNKHRNPEPKREQKKSCSADHVLCLSHFDRRACLCFYVLLEAILRRYYAVNARTHNCSVLLHVILFSGQVTLIDNNHNTFHCDAHSSALSLSFLAKSIIGLRTQTMSREDFDTPKKIRKGVPEHRASIKRNGEISNHLVTMSNHISH